MKAAFVTGSSRGIGKSIAKRLVEAGWSVYLHYSQHGEEAKILSKELGEACLGVFQANLAKPAEVTRLAQAISETEQLDALINNAGAYENLDFAGSSTDEMKSAFNRLYQVNFNAPLELIHAAATKFKQQGSGKVLNVCSRVAHRGEPMASCYSVSKAALLNLTRSLAVEMAPYNIQHFALAPGWVDTAMARDGMNDRLPEILQSIPLGRMATPEDCAGAAAYLLSDEAKYLSGIVIDINGASYLR